jgi:hypothetical protein
MVQSAEGRRQGTEYRGARGTQNRRYSSTLRKCSIRIQNEHSNMNIQEKAQKYQISNIKFKLNTITSGQS